MFSSLGSFKTVQCPKQGNCDLPACIFSHYTKIQKESITTEEYDPFKTSHASPPPAKRLKTNHEDMSAGASPLVITVTPSVAQTGGQGHVRATTVGTSRVLPNSPHRDIPETRASRLPPTKSSTETPKPQKPESATRPISPPTVKSKSTSAATKPELPKTELLVPRTVPSQPVNFQKRDSILKLFHAAIQSKDKLSAGGDSRWKALMLSEQELIKYAINREEEAARKYDGNVYQSHLGKQMVDFKKMTAKEWRTFVRETIRGEPTGPVEAEDTPLQRPSTGLGSLDEETAILRAIRTSIAGLEKFGYVTSLPTPKEIAAATAATHSAGGFEQCDRCGARFRVFPGRDEEGKLTGGGKCRYHWARPNRPPPQKTDRMTGSGQASHPCCGQLPGSGGCSEAETHVFNVKDAKRLASILQFQTTPENPNSVKTPVSFDCEMGYTTLGMEVIRVTAVSWPEGRRLLDVLVRPYGEILDFNTRFSGVSQRQFANAVKHGEEEGDCSTMEDGELNPARIGKAQSPAAARQLLLDLIGPETPLIGHAIENDLNTLRIIHPLIVDTVLLYPHSKGLPMRYGLKVLMRQHLDRSIQTSGAAGHDSMEDALATGDLVTLKVAEKWKQMKSAGWSFAEGRLVAPESKVARAAL